MADNSLKELFRAAKEGKWQELEGKIDVCVTDEPLSFLGSDPDPQNKSFTILHHACKNSK